MTYRAMLRRTPRSAEIPFWTRQGARSDYSPARVAAIVLASSEYRHRFGGDRDPDDRRRMCCVDGPVLDHLHTKFGWVSRSGGSRNLS